MSSALSSPADSSAPTANNSATNEATTARLKFEALTARLEEVATRDPKGYQRRVAALAILGYAYIFLILLVALALLAVLVAIVIFAHRFNVALLKIGFFVAIFAFVTVKSLFVRIPPPEGRELTREEAPQLFEHVEEIGTKLNAPRPHHVLLTDEFNAAVSQVPRFGLFGGQRNYLIVGLQLMDSLSPEEFKSVLAHEFGHLSANHSRFSGWIYRVRQTWTNLMEGFEGGHDWIFSKFFNWYAPYFAAYSFVLARQNEYVADRCAAELCGARTAADALTRGEVVGGFLNEKVWPSVFSRAGREAQPPRDIYSSIRQAIGTPLDPALANRWLSAAVHRPTDSVDTHPSLAQRLTALGQEPRLGPLPTQSAAEFYLGAQLEPLTAQLEQGWSQAIAPIWGQRHQELAQTREKLDAIRAKGDDLTDEEQWLLADATEDFGDEEGAFTLFQQYLASHPNEARAQFTVGRLLIARGDEAGLSHLERAVALEHEATIAAAQIAENFLLQGGRTAEAAVWRELGLSYQDRLALAGQERQSVLPSDTFLPHELHAEEVERLRQHFAQFETVEKVLMARKQVQHFPDMPFYVGGLVMSKKKFTISSDEAKRTEAFNAALQNLNFERAAIFIQLDAEGTKHLRKPIEKVEGTLIYTKAT